MKEKYDKIKKSVQTSSACGQSKSFSPIFHRYFSSRPPLFIVYSNEPADIFISVSFARSSG